ncbi:MAG: hypothetical protein M1309_06995 [Actinobacteria bacterium]|nr:hypothetical protein [Actinomycetota bacterium]
MAIEGIVEERSHFEQGIRKWQQVEDVTIESCEALKDATENILVQTVAGIIRADSVKHKEVLDVILRALDGTITLTPEELGGMSSLLDNHLNIERDSIALAMDELENSRHFVIRELLSYLLEDERKHYKLMSQLNDFKRQLYPYA